MPYGMVLSCLPCNTPGLEGSKPQLADVRFGDSKFEVQLPLPRCGRFCSWKCTWYVARMLSKKARKTNQPVDQPTNQPINQPTNKSKISSKGRAVTLSLSEDVCESASGVGGLWSKGAMPWRATAPSFSAVPWRATAPSFSAVPWRATPPSFSAVP